jgi:hypothetical protein
MAVSPKHRNADAIAQVECSWRRIILKWHFVPSGKT